MKVSINKKALFTQAWSLFKSNIYSSFASALSAAWKSLKVKAALLTSKVEVTFRKANGEITTRIATLCTDFFSYESNNNSSKSTKAGLIKFYSLTDSGFRAARIERLISYKTVA